MPQILIATSNPHKLDEFAAIFREHDLEPVGLDSVDADIPEPVENGETFERNAAIKALAYAEATGRVCLADDSGLEVDALDDAPGVHSARFAGVDGDRAARDAANNERLLKELGGLPDEQRTARFVCAVCVAAPEGHILLSQRGTVEGRIATEPRGENGFGYDPLFVLDDGRTSAELSANEKNKVSHRAQAARVVAPQLASMAL